MIPLYLQTKDDGKVKPAPLKLYDFTKGGGADIVDQRIGSYTVKTKSKRWTVAAFVYILDTARVNSGTIYALKKGSDPRKLNSFQFGLDIAISLVIPQILRRRKVGLQKNIINKILRYMKSVEKVENDDTEHVDEVAGGGINNFPSVSESAKRCAPCLYEI